MGFMTMINELSRLRSLQSEMEALFTCGVISHWQVEILLEWKRETCCSLFYYIFISLIKKDCYFHLMYLKIPMTLLMNEVLEEQNCIKE